MKKFLLLLSFMVICRWANAIDLTFYYGDTPINPGETVKFTDIRVENFPEEGVKEVIMKPMLYLGSNIYSSDIKITATCTSGQSIGLCAGGICKGGETVVKEKVTVRPGQKIELGFDYIDDALDIDAPIPTVITRIEAEDVTEEGSKVEFIIEMGEKDASVTMVKNSDTLKAMTGGVAYSAETSAPLHIASLLGVTHFKGNVIGKGTINLPKGLYVYKLGAKTGKVYVP